MKSILVLNASPRENGNTRKLSEAFITRCIQRGFDVKKYNIPDMNIEQCIDCGRCFEDDNPCIQEDDFNEIANEIVKADVIVFSLPVYFYSIPGKFKMFIDKLICFQDGNKNISEKLFAIISACEDKDMTNFDGVRIPLEKMGKDFGWILLDEILAPGMARTGDIENTDGVRRAKELADKIV
ncbi:MAG: flavodoxin family protein [Bacilli bacterium]|nr:flavodoxin family protein [Bacilli bacterium]